MHWLLLSTLGLLLAGGLWTASCVYALIRNYKKARQLGLHVVINFVQPLNPVWALISNTFLPLLQKLPFDLDYYFNYTAIDWNYRDNYQSHERYGEVFCVVNPKYMEVVVGDAAAIDEIASRRKDFTKPEEFYSRLVDARLALVENLTPDCWQNPWSVLVRTSIQ